MFRPLCGDRERFSFYLGVSWPQYSGLRDELPATAGRVPEPCFVDGWTCGSRALDGRLSAHDEMG